MLDISILIIEDEVGISNIERKYLEKEGYLVDQSFNGEDALIKIKENRYDLILLDLMLPGVSGEEIMEYIRTNSETPVIMVTAKVEEEQIVKGLKLGADDYISKPFSPKEMVQRVKTVLRRVEKYNLPKSEWLNIDNGRIKIDFDNHKLLKNGQEVSLTNNEFKIIQTLFSNPQKIFTREEIIEIAFGMHYDAYDRAIDTHIKNIRHKIEDQPKSPKYIKTVYGVGYKAGLGDEV
ncbi:response regulator transcription factor [Gallicola sp. Sow4_E12]|uniref:response regulator transcription factor n=1 Tax=Gallicola sp. Sow4_E12 TaxID=3438785 RepID=UPI003F910227